MIRFVAGDTITTCIARIAVIRAPLACFRKALSIIFYWARVHTPVPIDKEIATDTGNAQLLESTKSACWRAKKANLSFIIEVFVLCYTSRSNSRKYSQLVFTAVETISIVIASVTVVGATLARPG